MKKLLVKDIFSIPSLDYFIEPENCMLFLKKRVDFEEVANVVNSSRMDIFLGRIDELGINVEEGPFGEHIEYDKNSDSLVTAKMDEKMKKEYIKFSNKISPEKLLLFLSAITKDFLKDLNAVKNNVPGNFKVSELCYSNGDILRLEGNNIILNGENISASGEQIQEFEDRMIEGILIANQELNSLNKNANNFISGNYKPTGNAPIKRISYSQKELYEYSQSSQLLKRLSFSKMGELLDKRLISKNTLIRLISRGELDKNTAIQLMLAGKLTQEEVLSRVFKVQKMSDLVLNKNINYESKLLLYSTSKININLLEKSVRKYQEENIDLTETFRKISKYYTNDITKISELLTHNILDYNNSQRFLSLLEEEGKITSSDRSYLEDIMSEFKINELLNDSKNEVISISGEGGQGPGKYRPGLTIDPNERIEYLKSLGAVKKIKIRGENFIKDSKENVGKKNSLDGYELFVIPEKRIAILEKLYETTRNKNGEIEYRKDKEGKLIPALQNATYVIPIEMATEFSRKKNKKELIENPEVRKVNHSMDWVSNLECKISSLMKCKGIEVKFDEKNTDKWSERIRKNYLENKKKREIEVK